MSAVLLPLVLVASCICIAFGVVRLYTWFLDRRDARSLAAWRERLLVEAAQAELDAVRRLEVDSRDGQEARRHG